MRASRLRGSPGSGREASPGEAIVAVAPEYQADQAQGGETAGVDGLGPVARDKSNRAHRQNGNESGIRVEDWVEDWAEGST
eukprot:882275-Heterocapsa_arctica.AAC.1